MEPLTDLERNKTFFVLTGDIAGFTKVEPEQREKLIAALGLLIKSRPHVMNAQTFRGDSFQILFTDSLAAVRCCFQIRCWLKQYPHGGKLVLDARVALGAGKLDQFFQGFKVTAS